ncbi:bifunctional biotin--[acetyl-CoA-carboxylase] ligase/biotin operon repressor BirA [Shewanella psychrotolerans]|uniref:bifunctional biotin--[acetyl-CoA-carboxylase] ligase/biotin operon repressor BirA n=1 Tax=Shewanella psychrotolerans TaxID=2864206 RepID=UPI001C65B3D0|nr:bifunctional biotin--[acetyl-CoA-carboxylase] ligase/biotin operon repressor BirA [Shewanella psychrotolerans]QYK03172.1 bifunctional biotin--[acetyl-CoA-carboxylase] ligase/biotin operon repressor BirA [Shewanella psychrotolerans]
MHDQWQRKRAIIAELSRGGFISGEVLAANLGISRAAVSKHIASLEEFGVDVFSVKGKGYKLATPLSLIDEKRLKKSLNARCFYFDDIVSTNAFLLDHVNDLASGDICVAEHQSAGRGRRGRTWVSPYGGHLYASLYWQFSQGMAQAMGLSLVVACSLVTVLRNMGVAGVGVKWPNDIYLNHKKLAGVLIEMNGQADSLCNVVIGIGVNMSMPEQQSEKIDQPWSDLSELTEMPDKTSMMIQLQQQLVIDLEQFESDGLKVFKQRWRDVDLFDGQPIKLLMGDNVVEGICCGIDEQGAVLLETAQGVKAYVGGEISLRAQ